MTSNGNGNQLQPLTGVRQKKESDRAVQACNDWLRLGAGRSVPVLIANYTDKDNFSNSFTPPSIVYATLSAWSSRFGWPQRATDYDATWEERKNAERETMFNRGVSLDYERVERLQRLLEFLESQLYEQGEGRVLYDEDGEEVQLPDGFYNVWLPDVKQIGSGEDVERVDIERFNAALISEYRSVLDDIAKETGGRIRKQEVTGKDGKDLLVKVVYEDYNPKTS